MHHGCRERQAAQVVVNILNVFGLVYDVVGAFLLARAFAFGRDKILAAQSLSVVGSNPALFAALAEQRLDARFGIGILIAGFLFQLLAALNVFVSVGYWPWFVLALAMVLGWYFVAARRLKRGSAARLNALTKGVKHIQDLL